MDIYMNICGMWIRIYVYSAVNGAFFSKEQIPEFYLGSDKNMLRSSDLDDVILTTNNLVDKKQICRLLEVDHPGQWQFEEQADKVVVEYKHLVMVIYICPMSLIKVLKL